MVARADNVANNAGTMAPPAAAAAPKAADMQNLMFLAQLQNRLAAGQAAFEMADFVQLFGVLGLPRAGEAADAPPVAGPAPGPIADTGYRVLAILLGSTQHRMRRTRERVGDEGPTSGQH